ncbi:MAG: ribonuclease G [Gammaproteobacteria bacterium]|nr:ribonuclease G [Gammaproteobacteria bacterium]
MSEEILINVTPQETRVAVVENGVLQEVFIERARSRGIVGNIYKGKVARILPGMQAAFIDIGLDRAAFLHASDVRAPAEGVVRAPPLETIGATVVARNGNGTGPAVPKIQELLHDGQELIVQVVKDQLGSKGARLTTQVTLPARYLVYMPYSSHIGVSQKIGDDIVRERLRTLIRAAIDEGDQGGYIVRTLAEAATEDELRTDIRYLRRIWRACEERIQTARAGELIHEELTLAIRTMRDLVRDSVEEIRIDSRETFEKAREFALEFIPEVADRIEHYPGERPIFDLYGVEDEIKKALVRKVLLKSGGYLVIDQTEAMTTIDVNTGAYVGRHNLEETLFKTNLEAAQAIARQLRLRNLGGMIIVDFIDMEDPDHRRAVLRALEKVLARDRTKVYMTEMSALGLVELTRKRTRESLEHVLCQPCPACQGRGTLKTPHTVSYEIFREILREARQFGADEYMVVASQAVIDLLLDEEAVSLLKLQEFIGKPIQLKVEPLYHQEQYDVVLL